jgi:hypothetical protein
MNNEHLQNRGINKPQLAAYPLDQLPRHSICIQVLLAQRPQLLQANTEVEVNNSWQMLAAKSSGNRTTQLPQICKSMRLMLLAVGRTCDACGCCIDSDSSARICGVLLKPNRPSCCSLLL